MLQDEFISLKKDDLASLKQRLQDSQLLLKDKVSFDTLSLELEKYIPLQEMQQMQMQQMAMQAGPNAIQEGVKALGNSYVEAQRQAEGQEG